MIDNGESGLSVRTELNTALGLASTALQPATIGVSVQGYAAAASQAEMEAGTETALRSMSPLRVKQAVGAASASLLALAYDARADLRTNNTDTWAVVDGLGMFQRVVGSTEPDDDESCFATASARWLLECVHWDVVDAWQSPDDAVRDASFPGRILFGSSAYTLTSLATNTQTSFNLTVSGATTADHVIVTPPNALGSKISIFARVTATDTVTVYINNPSSSSQALTSGTWRVAVIKETF